LKNRGIVLAQNKPQALIPMQTVGPIKIIGSEVNEAVKVPLATFETPLWLSVNRGAKITRLVDGISVVIVKEGMTRSILLEAPNAEYANQVVSQLETKKSDLVAIVSDSSNFAKLQDWHAQIVGNLLYLRFTIQTGDAAGHNMTTKAAERLIDWLVKTFNQLRYVSISGNYCVDKKASAINGILGRGKYVIVESVITNEICIKHLRTAPQKIVELNIKKNLIGTNIAGGINTANAHFANMLLAFYLATGQDAANIIEGSQGITYAEMRGKDLYFSVTIPNIIVGSVGNGKELDFVRVNLEMLGCRQKREVGQNARRLAIIAAATVWCGELSLLAALTNHGELMRAHTIIER
jgi:hydroxymethylglutaryl-CoA reductase (NADPH)